MIKSTTNDAMTVTLTASYRDTLAAATVEKIDELLEDNYDLQAMLVFIDEYNEGALIEHYEEYVRCGEEIGYEAVDALAAEDGIDYITDCDERYQGFYNNEAEFAEDYYNQIMDIPDGLIIDWEAMWERNLYYDFTSCNDGSTYRPCHIFRDN